jgi:hypothetical protein
MTSVAVKDLIAAVDMRDPTRYDLYHSDGNVMIVPLLTLAEQGVTAHTYIKAVPKVSAPHSD